MDSSVKNSTFLLKKQERIEILKSNVFTGLRRARQTREEREEYYLKSHRELQLVISNLEKTIAERDQKIMILKKFDNWQSRVLRARKRKAAKSMKMKCGDFQSRKRFYLSGRKHNERF